MRTTTAKHEFHEELPHLLAQPWNTMVLGLAQILDQPEGLEFAMNLYHSVSYHATDRYDGYWTYRPAASEPEIPIFGDLKYGDSFPYHRHGRGDIQRAVLRAMAIRPDDEYVDFLLEQVDQFTKEFFWENKRKPTGWEDACFGELVLYALTAIGTEETLEKVGGSLSKLDEPESALARLLRMANVHGEDMVRVFLDQLSEPLIGAAVEELSGYAPVLSARIALEMEPTLQNGLIDGYVSALTRGEPTTGQGEDGPPATFRKEVLDDFDRGRILDSVQGVLEGVHDELDHMLNSPDYKEAHSVLGESSAPVQKLLQAYREEDSDRALPALFRFCALDDRRLVRVRNFREFADDQLMQCGENVRPFLQSKVSSENERYASGAVRLLSLITPSGADEDPR